MFECSMLRIFGGSNEFMGMRLIGRKYQVSNRLKLGFSVFWPNFEPKYFGAKLGSKFSLIREHFQSRNIKMRLERIQNLVLKGSTVGQIRKKIAISF